MEEERTAFFSSPTCLSSGGTMEILGFVFPVLKRFVFHNKKTLCRTAWMTAGVRILGPFIARQVWNIFSKQKP